MKKSGCKGIKELAISYLQGDLDSNQIQEVESHLSECPSCRQSIGETREMVALMKKDTLPDPGQAFWDTLTSRIMTQVRAHHPEFREVPWYKKIWTNTFSWPGYAWATALILMLLTPAVVYQIYFTKPEPPLVSENKNIEFRWEPGGPPLSALVENLSEGESVRLANKMMSRMGKDLTNPNSLAMEEELQWDIPRSLEGLTGQELKALIKKMEPGGSAVYKGEEENVC